MRLQNEFQVPAPPERVWRFLLDVERVAPCIPGAEVTERVDDSTWKGRVNIRLGPVAMAFAGTLVQYEVDAAARRVVLKARGTEVRGKGMAAATLTSQLDAADGRTRVVVVTDLHISGAAAQYGRGMLADVSKRFTDEFADCLAARLGEEEGATRPSGPPAAAPVAGIRLALWAAFMALKRGLRRILPSRGE